VLDQQNRNDGQLALSPPNFFWHLRLLLFLLRRLMGPGDTAQRDAEPVPAVDGDNRQYQVNQIPFRRALACELVHVVRDVRLVDQRDRLRPLKRRAFTLGKERCFAPLSVSSKPSLASPYGLRNL
jgi:hypothetical protein